MIVVPYRLCYNQCMDDSHTDPVVAEVAPSKNPFKALSIVLSFLVVLLVGAVSYLLLTTADLGSLIPTGDDTNTSKSYSVNLETTALSQPAKEKVLTINDLSDSFASKYLTISEWDLKLKTKYADILEYEFLSVTKNKDGSTPYAACNDDYLVCDSIVAIRIKKDFVDVDKENEKAKAAYGDTAKAYSDDPELRTVAYIYQDNRALSQSGTTSVRYWESDAFTTEFGKRGTLLFENAKVGGENDYGFANCGVALTVQFSSDTPCEDIYLSLYRFDASKL